MTQSALLFAFLAGISFACYSVFGKLGSGSISPPLGAMVISTVAFSVNLAIVIAMRRRGLPVTFTSRGVMFLVAVGLSAAGVDLFALMAYSRGLRVTSSLIITGTQAAFVFAIGFLVLRDPFSWGKLAGLLLIVAGVVVLQRFGV